MSKEHIDNAWKVATKPQIKLALVFLAQKANAAGLAKVSLDDIAEATGMPKSLAFTSVRMLESRKIIRTIKDASGQHYNLTGLKEYVNKKKVVAKAA